MPHSPDDPLLFTVFNEVGIIEQLARTAFERVLPAGLTVPQFSVLNHFVRLGGPKTPAQLADAFQVSRTTMSNTLGRLVAAGYIAERPDPQDGRSKLIDITPQGRAARAAAVAAVAPLLEAIAGRIDAGALAAALPALQMLRAELDAGRDLADALAETRRSGTRPRPRQA